jgi:predicted PurR-regulated permease PerM
MTAGRRIAGFAAIFVGLWLALWLLSPVLLPFVLGLGIAYLLNPAVARVENWGFGHGAATGLVIGVFFFVLAVAALLLIAVLQVQLVGLLAKLAQGAAELYRRLWPMVEGWAQQFGIGDFTSFGNFGDVAGKVAIWIGGVLAGLWSGGLALFNLASLVLIMPVVAFYLLRDWNRLLAAMDGWLPRDHAPVVRDIVRQIDLRMWGFLRGQALVCLLLGLFYAIALTAVGLNYGLSVGLLTGILSFIPYAGVIVGMAVGLLIAYFQFDAWLPVGLVLAVFVVGQFVEGNFVSPRLVGERVGLHPVWLLLAVMAGGALLGFVGVVLAVPAAAAIGVLLRFALERYLASSLYRGAGGSGRTTRGPP